MTTNRAQAIEITSLETAGGAAIGASAIDRKFGLFVHDLF